MIQATVRIMGRNIRLRYFKGTKALQNVIVSEDELKDAYFRVMTGQGGAYVKGLFDIEGIRYVPYHEELRLADDILLFAQKSHTAGCTGMVQGLRKCSQRWMQN